MSANAVRHVRNVTPRTRSESIVAAFGLLLLVIGYLSVAVALMSALGAAVTVAVGFALIATGKRLRRV